MKKIIPIITLTAIVLCMMKNVQVKADTLPASYEILAGQPGIDLTSIISAYESLNSQQKLIAEYLVGAYDNIYLTARGFKYNITYDETNLKAQFSALGSRVFDFITTRIGWKSRVNEVFRQFLSSVIVYAAGVTTTFSNWFDGQKNGTDPIVFIPYSEQAFDAWTTFYNDPSGDGIAYFGDYVTAWNSGEYEDFAFVGYSWRNNNYQDAYNNFILVYSPVMYSDQYASGSNQFQHVFGLVDIPNALFIQRGNSYQYYRYGYSDNFSNHTFRYYDGTVDLWHGGLGFTDEGLRNRTLISYSVGPYSTLNGIVNKAFDDTPFRVAGESYGDRFYPFIEHVYLVDDINTLSNPTEIYNTESLNIASPSDDKYIIAPNGRMILPSWPGAPDDPLGFWDLIVDGSFNEEGDDVTEDDYHTSIVNNNVINNYYVSDDVKINVPVDWFENPYTDQLNTEAQDFIGFARDCVDCLGDFDIYMYGAIVVGLAGGIVKKLLL